MAYEIIWKPGGVIRRYFGHVTAHELSGSVTKMQGDSRFDDLRYVINDFQGSTGLMVSTSEIDEIAAIEGAAAISNRDIRIAMVATTPEAIALAHHYSSSPLIVHPIRIFGSLDGAHTWLGLPPAREAYA